MGSCVETPLVTVGIPSYNRPDGLRNTLTCISGQTYSHLEILVSDNCSQDPEIKKVVEEFAEKDSRIVYIRQSKNIGPLQNFLFLARKAQGEYFMWAADDDWWDSHFIEKTASLLNDHPDASIAFARFTPSADNFFRKKRYPDFFVKNKEFCYPDRFKRLRNYIRQNEVYGKAHLIYGLIRRSVLLESIDMMQIAVSSVTDINDLPQADTILNFAVLSGGRLVLCDECLRKFGSAPRKLPRRENRNAFERILSYDGRAMDYLNSLNSLLEVLDMPDEDRLLLYKAIRNRKIKFIAERIGRRLFVYKIYWHFVKRFTFRTIADLTAP